MSELCAIRAQTKIVQDSITEQSSYFINIFYRVGYS